MNKEVNIMNSLLETILQLDPRTATGVNLRNLADYIGVEYEQEDSDAEVRRLYFETKEKIEEIYEGVPK